MGLNYEGAKNLFAVGHYVEIVARSDVSDGALARLDPGHRILLAQALLHVNVKRALQIAEKENAASASPSVRSRCELLIGMAQRRNGAFEQALSSLRRAVHLAKENGDIHQIAWTYVHLFRLVAEFQPHDTAVAVLQEARPFVTRAADPHITAFMHDAIALIEASTGRLAEAQRHLNVSATLIESNPNAWLGQIFAVSAFCVAFLGCDYPTAARHLEHGKRLLSLVGDDYLRNIFALNEGHAALLTGRFRIAEERLQSAGSSPYMYCVIGALEGMARLLLATDRLNECAETLSRIDSIVAMDQELLTGFTARWAAITRVRLHLRRNLWKSALAEAAVALGRATTVQDQYMISALAGLRAEALAGLGKFDKAGSCLLAASETAPELAERQAEYHHSVAGVLNHVCHPIAAQVQTRAHAIWNEQGNRLGPVENARNHSALVHTHNLPQTAPAAGSELSSSRSIAVINALASAVDLASNPRLLGAELVNVITMLECSPHVTLIEESHLATESHRKQHQYALQLGKQGSRKFTLVCGIPKDALHAVALGDVLRLARATLALDKARQDERNRAAIWPAAPVEEQAGVLFLAEEMQTLLSTARRIAPTTVPVLITGETGTGKEVLARLIHAYSARANATFLPFNCSGVPKDMLDSQLFGHRRGAFTGAIDHFPGVIRSATGGTLFLDEIGETTLDVQPKLLRFLEASEVHPIGETQPVKVDVRVIAATNADLDALVAERRFREDLFYRLNIVRLHVPPLRERRVEIPALANHYLQKHAQEYRKGDLRIAEETMEYLVLYRWPGNVRQLANEMRRMAALAETGAVLMPEHLSPEIAASRRTLPPSERALEPTELVVRIDQPVAAAVQHLERAMIQYALKKCGGRMEDSASALGLSRKGLYLKRLRYGLEPRESAAPAADVA